MKQNNLFFIIIGAVVFLGIALFSTYFILGKDKTLGFLRRDSKQETISGTPVTKINDNVYRVSGKIAEPLRMNSDDMLETQLLIDLEPTGNPVRLIFEIDIEGGGYVYESGTVKVAKTEEFINLLPVGTHVTIEMRILGSPLSLTNQELKDGLEVLANGKWNPVSNRRFFLLSQKTFIN